MLKEPNCIYCKVFNSDGYCPALMHIYKALLYVSNPHDKYMYEAMDRNLDRMAKICKFYTMEASDELEIF